MYIELEPLLALVAGVAALVVPPSLGTRIVGAYLVLMAVLMFTNYI